MTGAIILCEDVEGKKNLGSSRIRGHWLIKYWEDLEKYEYAKKYDFIIFQKAYLVDFAKIYKGIKILDMCDPDWLGRRQVLEMIQECDAVTCSTENIAKVIGSMTDKPVVTIKDRHDPAFFKEKKFHTGQAKEAIWYGYDHNSDCIKAIKYAIKRYGLNLTVISDKSRTFFTERDKYEGTERWKEWDIKTINENIVAADIVLMPGSKNPNYRFKSNNKTVNAWFLQMPVATAAQEIERFLDPAERNKEAAKNYQIAMEEYNITKSVEEYKELINELANRKKKD